MDRILRPVLAVLIIALVGSCGSAAESPSASPAASAAVPTPSPALTPTPTPEPTPSSTPTQSPGPAGPFWPENSVWKTVPLPPPDATRDAGHISALTEFGDGFVAVGTPVCDWQQEPWACQLSAWATDGTGRAWVRSPDQPAFDMGGGGEALIPEGLFDVTDGPAGLVAIGHPLDGSSGAVWHSRDGRTWERLPLVFEDADPIAVASGPLGYVITARDIAPGPDRIGTAYAWFSADGRTWVPREDGPDLDVGPCHDTTEIPSCAGMRAVAATPTGFVAVGSVAGPDGERGPAVWSTPDGRTWKRTSVPLGVGDGLADIVWTGTELIAVGGTCGADCADGRADGLIATSSDGSTWAVERPSGAPDFDLIAGDDRQRWAVSLPDAETIDTLQLWRSDQTGAWELVDDLPAMPSGLTFLGYHAVDIEVVADGSVLLVGWMEVRGSIEGGLDLSLVRS